MVCGKGWVIKMRTISTKMVAKDVEIIRLAARVKELEYKVKFWQAIFFEKNLNGFKKA